MIGFRLESRTEDVILKKPYASFYSYEHLQPFIHLGGPISTSNGRMDISTLAVYNLPCNVSIDDYEMAVSTCPQRLLVSLPMFTTSSV